MARRPFICVYMMTNKRHGTLYIGVTSDLVTRVCQHRDGEAPGFTATYGLKRLVWFEPHDTIVEAIQREKSLKKYKREWKINLIEQDNPQWDDLSRSCFSAHLSYRTSWPGVSPGHPLGAGGGVAAPGAARAQNEIMGPRDKPGDDGAGG